MSESVQPHGSWMKVGFSGWVEYHQEKIVTAIALLALAMMAGGGVLLYLKSNMIIAYTLIGGGAAILVSDGVVGVALFLSRNDEKKQKLPSESEGASRLDQPKVFRIFSWNVGTIRDYANICLLRDLSAKSVPLAQAFDQVPEYNAREQHIISPKDKNLRKGIFQRAFENFGNPEIICLQESHQLNDRYLTAILPQGYTFFRAEGSHCAIAWRTDALTMLSHGRLAYIHDKRAADTLVRLEDIKTRTTLCVGSAHVKGFSLARVDTSLDKVAQQQALQEAVKGDQQIFYDLATLEEFRADLYVYAGDFNADPKIYKPRFDVLEGKGYSSLAPEATILDKGYREPNGEPKPLAIDHIYAKSREGLSMEINPLNFSRQPLHEFNQRPSDHLPIGATIVLGASK